jgi:hypothetical protein
MYIFRQLSSVKCCVYSLFPQSEQQSLFPHSVMSNFSFLYFTIYMLIREVGREDSEPNASQHSPGLNCTQSLPHCDLLDCCLFKA